MLYSKSENGFFDSTLHANTMPADAVEISDALYTQLVRDLNNGASLMADANRVPFAKFPDPPTVSELLELAKKEMREPRAEMLDALNGIASRAQRSGNAELASEADDLAQQLLDITDDPALNSATNLNDMRASALAAYKRIASGASTELAVVFKEITGA